MNNNINKISNNNDEYKKKFEDLLKKEELLNERIKILEQSLKKKDELNEITTKSNMEFTIKLQEVANNWMNSKATIEELKRFINQNIDPNKSKNIFEELNI